jgi:plastocyanin
VNRRVLRSFAVAFAVFVVGASIAACGADAPSAPGFGGGEAAGAGATTDVDAIDNSFLADTVTVAAGSTVTWTNNGRNDHNIVPVDANEKFGVQLADFKPGASYSHMFAQPGTYRYFCSIHGTKTKGMTGTVVVTGDGSTATVSSEPAAGGTAQGVAVTRAVPADYPSISAAVGAAAPGDLILVSPGTYHEAVNVTTDNLTIRGLDRNDVVLDGQFKLDNGIRVLGAKGVAIENMTAKNYTSNGFFWTGVKGYRGSYLTATRNGDYGIYAYDSYDGLLEHDYASGSPDAGFYIGECFRCNAVMDDVISEYNGLGYSGTNAGGDLYIVRSRFNNNRVGINTNSATYELCYPQRSATIVGNLVYSNNQTDTPAIDDARLGENNGILIEGGIGDVVERNRVYDHVKTGIGLVPFPEYTPNDVEPPESQWGAPCSETKKLPLPTGTINSIFWLPRNNRIVGNVTEANGHDLALAAVATDLSLVDPTTLGNCFSDNTFTTSAPTDIELLLPCDGSGSGGDWKQGDLEVVKWIADFNTAPPSVDFKTAATPVPPRLDGMPDPATAPAAPATNVPPKIDIASIPVPPKPAG